MLPKAGIIMMTLALAFAAGVAVYALLDEPMERAIVSKPAAKRSLEPLVRSSHWGSPRSREQRRHRKPSRSSNRKRRQSRSQNPSRSGKCCWEPGRIGRCLRTNRSRRRADPATMMCPRNDNGTHNRVPRHLQCSGFQLDQPVGSRQRHRARAGDLVALVQHSQRKVYLAGHRFGWPGSGSHLVFYNLAELARGMRSC